MFIICLHICEFFILFQDLFSSLRGFVYSFGLGELSFLSSQDRYRLILSVYVEFILVYFAVVKILLQQYFNQHFSNADTFLLLHHSIFFLQLSF